jgi:hypothetical protein
MLWYKAWLETRWRFLTGLVLLTCSAASVVFVYPVTLKLIPLVPPNLGGEIGQRIRESVELSREYRGYVWSHWFGQNLEQMATLFAVLLGTGGLLSRSSGGEALFALSMPVSRNRLLGVRAAAGLAELAVLTFVPSLLIPLLSPMVHETYGVGNALVHSTCTLVASSVFFSLAFLLSSAFGDLWRPLLIALSLAAALALAEQFLGSRSHGIFHVMSGETYFRSGRLPWPGLLGSAAASAALYRGTTLNVARRDF